MNWYAFILCFVIVPPADLQ
jgi:hypothetical protein